MSLIHWWPLNGDLQDKIQGKIFNNGGWTSASSGKIGTTYNANIGAILSASLSIPNTFSFACWVKNNDLTYPQAPLPMKFSNGAPYSTASTSNKGWEFSHGNNSKLTLNNGSTAQELNFGTPHASYLGSWYHLVFTVDCHLKKASLFINGELKGEKSFTVTDFSGTYTFSLGQIHGWKLDGFVNDIRIYDHVLSQAEVKELSKALVIHYTFDDILAEPTTNLVTQGALGWSKLTVNVSSSHSNGVYTITTTTANNDAASGQIRANFPLAILTTGATYYFSCKYRVISGTGSFSFSDWCDSSLSDKKTKNCGDFYELSAKCYTTRTYNSTYRFLDCNISANSVIEVWDVQLQTNDKVTPYVLGTRESMLVNETGLSQPSTKNNILLSTDSGTGTYSLQCKGNTQVVCTNIGDITQGVTVSFWVKCSIPSDSRLVFADNNSKIAFGFFNNGQAIITCAGYGHACVSNIRTNWNTEWNHIIVRRTSSNTVECYINGIKQNLSGSQEWTHNSANSLSIGCRYSGGWTSYFTGLIDDFRYYNTCLSENDIQELYKTKAYITDKGDIETHHFIEDKTQAQVTSKYCFEADEFYEELYPGYDILEYIESSGTQYVDTGYVTTSTDYTYELDMTPTKIGGFYSYMGFMASGTTPRAGIHEYSNVFMIGANATTNSSTTPVVNERIVLKGHFKSGAQKLYKNNVQIASNTNTFSHSSNTLSTHIFGRNYSSGRNLASMKLYSAKIYEGSTLVRHYIPARRQSDNALGLYELLNGTFHANSGSGTFVSGPAITNKNASIYEDMHVSGREIIEI